VLIDSRVKEEKNLDPKGDRATKENSRGRQGMKKKNPKGEGDAFF